MSLWTALRSRGAAKKHTAGRRATTAQSRRAIRAALEPLESRILLSWIGATSGSTNDAAHNYNNTANWSGGVINDSFAGSALSANTTIYVTASRTTASTGLNLNYTGNFNLTIESSSTTAQTITINGGITDSLGGTTRTITLGNATNVLNLNLDSATQTLDVAAGDELAVLGVVSRPWLIGVRIKMKTPNPNGLSSLPEGPVFDKIQSALNSALHEKLNAVGVGEVTTAGWWEFYYYAAQTAGFPNLLAAALREFSAYEKMNFAREDKAWTLYRSILLPSQAKREHQILNQQVIQSLKDLGCDLTQPLRINHAFLFPTAEKRNAAIQTALAGGYAVTDQFETDPSNPPNFALQLSRTDVPEIHSMQALVFHLIDLATSLNGKYDGWGAMVKP
jgi:regulator of RNase E activity RraB